MKVKGIVVLILMASFIAVAIVGPAAGQSVYLSANHHTGEFDAWNINADGTVTYQATDTLVYSTDPAGIAIDAVTADTTPIIFITSEFSGGVEIVNPVTLEYIGVSSGPSNLAGIDVDDVDDIVYALKRATRNLYIYQWDPVSKTLTQQATLGYRYPQRHGESIRCQRVELDRYRRNSIFVFLCQPFTDRRRSGLETKPCLHRWRLGWFASPYQVRRGCGGRNYNRPGIWRHRDRS
jgi:hypothetical protein